MLTKMNVLSFTYVNCILLPINKLLDIQGTTPINKHFNILSRDVVGVKTM